MSFNDLNLSEPLLRALDSCGFTVPTAIQREAIPVLLAGRDLMASAQTGTGKTAAFALPALERLQTRAPGHGPRVLVLAPTRELAMQVEQNFRQLGRFSRVKLATVVGGMAYPPQQRALSQPLDVLVATPGRLMDHMARGRVDFSRLEMLVLDEADRMLDMGFVDAVKDIAAATPATRQTVLFSATLEGRVLSVARMLLKDPAQVALAASATPHTNIDQRAYRADDVSHKRALLKHLIEDADLSQAVIFTGTKRGAEDLSAALSQNGHASAPLHGDMSQRDRRRTVDNMRRGQVRLLVATDVAARGLDISGITHVINFDLPMVAEDYIHRIGRTGRAGASGTAISLIGPEDRRRLGQVERLTGKRLDYAVVPGLEPRRPVPTGRPGGARPGGRPGGYKGKRGAGGGKPFAARTPRFS
ncbi:DEAD/DEAH box helicase [Ectothiorhodospiraceae bacterium 2226]|nr:DEAD/DEAH box helicase [Ectothiorhodospiraceae bacterium 2226]